MRYELTAEYSESLIRATTRRLLSRSLGWGFFLAWIAGLISFAVLLVLGERGWLAGAFGAFLALSGIAVAAAYITFYRRAVDVLHKMGTPQARFVFDDDGVSVASDLATGTMKWAGIEELQCFPEVWVLRCGKGAWTTLPTASLTSEAADFLVAKVTETGGRISE